MDEALQSHSCVISVMGAHANEGSETIFGRKMQDIDKTGTTYWLMRSPKARPPEVQDICKTTTSYVIFIEPASKGGARPTTTEDAASQFSPDRRSWKALPPGIGRGRSRSVRRAALALSPGNLILPPRHSYSTGWRRFHQGRSTFGHTQRQ